MTTTTADRNKKKARDARNQRKKRKREKDALQYSLNARFSQPNPASFEVPTSLEFKSIKVQTGGYCGLRSTELLTELQQSPQSLESLLEADVEFELHEWDGR